MRAKLVFTEEIDNLIKDSFNKGMKQTEIKDLLFDKLNFKCSLRILTERYKVLDLKVSNKPKLNVIKPWHKIFTNDEFPNIVTNCILYDLFNNWTIDNICKENNLTKSDIDKYIGGLNIDKNLRKRFGSYRKIYENHSTTYAANLNDVDTQFYIQSKVNEYFKGKAELISNYSIKVLNKEFTFDFYCKEANDLFITCPGAWCVYGLSLNNIGYNYMHIEYPKEVDESNLKDYIVSVIISRINRELNGEDTNSKRNPDYKPLSNELIEVYENKCLERKVGKPFMEICWDFFDKQNGINNCDKN